MAKPIIVAKNMGITYNIGASNEFKALRDVSAEIYHREYIILFGPSGCGKSTFMYSILGGLQPATGGITIKGEDIYSYEPEEMVQYQRSTVGIIYQAFNLIPSINVLDNVALPQIFMGIPLADRSKQARLLLRRFGIDGSLEKKIPATLSGGQQQRVAVARALVNNPEILLADEPVGNLDSISADQVMGKLEEINEKDRKTVILVTHDAKYLPYAHRVYYMRDGFLKRIVVNPEKRQIKRVKAGETIITEIEQLARIYPYDEPMQLKVKSIINYLTQNLTISQIQLLEKAILQILDGKMDRDTFYRFLVKPLKKGGVGVESKSAREMTEKMIKLVEQSRDVKRYRDEAGMDEMFFHQKKFIDRLKKYLVEEFNLELSDEPSRVLNDAIAERIGGIITKDEFEQKLNLPYDLGGAAFEDRVATQLTRYLEKLIAQGGYIIGEKE
jgi:putative ABC transport system ATP-binding protein